MSILPSKTRLAPTLLRPILVGGLLCLPCQWSAVAESNGQSIAQGFQVADSSILSIDTINGRVAIGKASATYKWNYIVMQ